MGTFFHRFFHCLDCVGNIFLVTHPWLFQQGSEMEVLCQVQAGGRMLQVQEPDVCQVTDLASTSPNPHGGHRPSGGF